MRNAIVVINVVDQLLRMIIDHLVNDLGEYIATNELATASG